MEELAVNQITFGQALLLLGVVSLLLIVPFWKLWTRTGHSGLWALLMVISPLNLILLWWLAFKRWPAFEERR